jgi:TonB family protein
MVLASVDGEADQRQAVKWAEIALAVEPERPERLVLHGAALLRANRPAESVAVLDEVARAGATGFAPSVFAFLALAHQRLGHQAEERRWSARAESALRRTDEYALQRSWGDLASEQGGLLLWEQRVELAILLSELRAARPQARSDAGAGRSDPSPVEPSSERPMAPPEIRGTPVKIVDVAPDYPDAARRAGIEGSVQIECRITTAGEVVDTRAISGDPLLTGAALAAVRQWRYKPALSHGVPVAVVMTVTVHFSLQP